MVQLYTIAKIKKLTPDKENALKYANEFDFGAWSDELRKFISDCNSKNISTQLRYGVLIDQMNKNSQLEGMFLKDPMNS